MPLNIDWQQILLHAFNFVILFAVLYFLLYKPVKDFMDKRAASYEKLEEETKANLAEAEKSRAEYAQKLAEADQEIAEKRSKAARELEAAGEAQRKEAREEAARLLEAGRKDLEADRVRMLRDAQKEIAGMAAQAAEKIMVGANPSQAYDSFLSAAESGEDHV